MDHSDDYHDHDMDHDRDHAPPHAHEHDHDHNLDHDHAQVDHGGRTRGRTRKCRQVCGGAQPPHPTPLSIGRGGCYAELWAAPQSAPKPPRGLGRTAIAKDGRVVGVSLHFLGKWLDGNETFRLLSCAQEDTSCRQRAGTSSFAVAVMKRPAACMKRPATSPGARALQCSSIAHAKSRPKTSPVQVDASTLVSAPEPSDWTIPRSQQAPMPAWAKHAVHVLQKAKLLPHENLEGVPPCPLNFWVDCSGINSEMFALRELQQHLQELVGASIRVSLYCICEKDVKARLFAQQNHAPHHISPDMANRNFETGTFYCEKCDANHELPRRGIDVYVGTYPCSPWSRRGKRTDFEHDDIQPFYIGIATINYLSPALFILETTEGADDHREGSNESAMDKMLDHIQKTLQQPYATHVETLQPTSTGFPARRPRKFTLGWRGDLGSPDTVAKPLRLLLQEPMLVERDYFSFLGLQCATDWSRVGKYPIEEMELAAMKCACSIDPMVVCPVHACKCHNCGSNGKMCSWRANMEQFLSKELPRVWANLRAEDGRLTYIHVLEASGRPGPQSPKARNMLNVTALLPASQPLTNTRMVIDYSQSATMPAMQADGTTPTFTTSTSLWSMQAGEALTGADMAGLMGFRMEHIHLVGLTQPWFKKKLGLSVHVASFGVIMLAGIASPLAQFWIASRDSAAPGHADSCQL